MEAQKTNRQTGHASLADIPVSPCRTTSSVPFWLRGFQCFSLGAVNHPITKEWDARPTSCRSICDGVTIQRRSSEDVGAVCAVRSSLWLFLTGHLILLLIALPSLPEYMDFLLCTRSHVASPAALCCLVKCVCVLERLGGAWTTQADFNLDLSMTMDFQLHGNGCAESRRGHHAGLRPVRAVTLSLHQECLNRCADST